MSQRIPLICLMGPTASGKTAVAVELVQHLPCEIISVDSAMVYRGMDIGTAKPDPDTLRRAPHRLLDIRDPKEAYSAAQFCDDAHREIADIVAEGKIPLLVGGTMLYFKALQQGLSVLPSADANLRAYLFEQGAQLGWAALHARLAEVDPVAAKRIHPHDAQRIQRALEVYELTGQSLTEWQQQAKPHPLSHPVHSIALVPSDRSVLHDRIAQRFDHMLGAGFIDEVEPLVARGDLTLETPAMRSVGYRQVFDYIKGQLSYDEMRDKGIAATRQLAKRQLTWLRSWPELTVFESESRDIFDQIHEYCQKMVNN